MTRTATQVTRQTSRALTLNPASTQGAPTRRFSCVVLAIVVALALTGCGTAEHYPTVPPSAATVTAEPVVDGLTTGQETSGTASSTTGVVEVTASGSTTPLDPPDDLDEPTLWVNSDTPAHSMIIATNKADGNPDRAGLHTYTLGGELIQNVTGFYPNNIDTRTDFPLGGRTVDLFATSDRTEDNNRLLFFTVEDDPREETYRMLLDISGSNLALDYEPYGQALFHDSDSDIWCVFVTQRRDPFHILQYEIEEGTGIDAGKIVFASTEPVRTIEYRPSHDGAGREPLTLTEGMSVDDEHQALYVGEELHGLLRYGALPEDGSQGTIVDTTEGEDGRILEDVEGITILNTTVTDGYVIVSGQDDEDFSRYEVYDRESNEHLHSITIQPEARDGGLPGAKGTDGIYGYAGYVSERYPHGLFIVHTDDFENEQSLLLMVAFEDIWP